MAITYKVDASHPVVRAHWQGAISVKELSDYWEVLFADRDAMACRGVITDARECQVCFSGDELQNCVRTYIEPGLQGRVWRSAVVVSKSVQHGVARQMGGWAAPAVELEVFSNETDALAWLLS